jgi:hypothetical protein
VRRDGPPAGGREQRLQRAGERCEGANHPRAKCSSLANSGWSDPFEQHVAILPKCPVPPFAFVALLPGAAGDQLHAAGDLVRHLVAYQQTNVVDGHNVVENAQPEALPRDIKPADPGSPVLGSSGAETVCGDSDG